MTRDWHYLLLIIKEDSLWNKIQAEETFSDQLSATYRVLWATPTPARAKLFSIANEIYVATTHQLSTKETWCRRSADIELQLILE